MVLPNPVAAGIKRHDGSVIPRSVESAWTTIVTDMTDTVASAGELKAPQTFAGTNVEVLNTAGGSRFIARQAYDATRTGMSTAPRVRFYGEDHAGELTRLDNADSAAVGVDLPGSPGNDMQDENGDTQYGNPIDLIGIDLQGCQNLICLVETNPVYTGGSDTVMPQVQVRVLN